MTYTRDTMPPVPAGMVRIADCGTYDRALDADTTPIAQATGALHGFPMVRLYHVTRGYVVAGSAMRWDEARWYVNWYAADGSRHGRAFAEAYEAAACTYFAEITDPQRVSAMRQQAAQREDEAREITARCEKVADAVKIGAAKTYRSGWQWRADWPGMRDWCGYAKTKTQALRDGRAAIMHKAYCDITE
jgi:hypothetical protein